MREEADRAVLRSRIVQRIQDIEAREWDSLVSSPGMRHEALRVMNDVLVSRDSIFCLVSDGRGPYAAIAARRHAQPPALRRVLNVSAHLGRFEGIQLRHDVALDEALPRLVPTLAKMARRRRCAAFSIYAPESDRALYMNHGFAYFGGPASNTSDLTGISGYEALLAGLPRGRRELKRARRRSEQSGVRFEVTSPPRGPSDELYSMLTETYQAHAEPNPFTPGCFERIWAAGFAEHILFSAYLGERLIAAVWCFRDGDKLTVAIAAIHYELARPSYAYFSILDEILRWAFAHDIRSVDWGISNDDIKSRCGAVTVGGFAAVKLALPLPSPVWNGVRALLGSRLAARALGEDVNEAG